MQYEMFTDLAASPPPRRGAAKTDVSSPPTPGSVIDEERSLVPDRPSARMARASVTTGLKPAATVNAALAGKAGKALGLVGTALERRIDSLADAITWLEDPLCETKRRAQFKSALKTLSRVIGLPPSAISADPESLRERLASASPAKQGLKPRTWIQAKSTGLSALRWLGVEVAASRDDAPLLGAWARLNDRLGERRLQIGLSRLLHFLSRTGVEPADVTAGTFDAFLAELRTKSLCRDADGAFQTAARMWNRAASQLPEWPQVRAELLKDKRRYSLPWDQFAPELTAEIELFLTRKANTDPLSEDYSRPTRPTTTEGRRKMLRQMASALILSDALSAKALTSLDKLTEPRNVRVAISYLRDARAQGQITEAHANMVYLLRTIARHWLKNEPRAEELKSLLKVLQSKLEETGQRSGVRPRNRERLRQFSFTSISGKPSNAERLIRLPQSIMAALGSKPDPTYVQSVRVMQALQVGILTFVPMRLKNLTELKLGEHLIVSGRGRSRSMRIRLPAAVTKTYRDYEAPLPSLLHPLMDAWTDLHRPRICPYESPYLFPNPSGQLRNQIALSRKLSTFIKRETGLEVHCHLFRHIAAKLYLDSDPAGIEIVRQLLGHTSINTTLKAYADLQTDPAFRRLEEVLNLVGYQAPRRQTHALAPWSTR